MNIYAIFGTFAFWLAVCYLIMFIFSIPWLRKYRAKVGLTAMWIIVVFFNYLQSLVTADVTINIFASLICGLFVTWRYLKIEKQLKT